MKTKRNCSKAVLGGLLLSLCLPCTLYPQHSDHAPNHTQGGYAEPDALPYADPKLGRENYRYRNALKNESRLYDFYRRQAKHYIDQTSVSDILPAFPGLDGGSYGHWGKNNDMGATDGRWDRLVIGPVLASIVQDEQKIIPKSLSIKLAGEEGLNVVFDSEYNQYRTVWHGGFLDFPEARWGIMGTPLIEGTRLISSQPNLPVAESIFRGYYVHDDQVVLSYEYDETPILELPFRNGTIPSPRFARVIEFPSGAAALQLPLVGSNNNIIKIINENAANLSNPNSQEHLQIYLDANAGFGSAILIAESGTLFLSIEAASPGSMLGLEFVRSAKPVIPNRVASESLRPSSYTNGGNSRWNAPSLRMPNILRRSEGPFSVDTLGVPLGNPFLSPMFLTGIDFFKNGNAAISTFFGDVWLVSDFLGQSPTTTWKRIATGLHHPLGLEIIDETIHVVGRDQVTALHDLNGDQEIDFYENIFNDFETHTGSHDFNTGLQKDDQGNFYFASAKNGVIKFSTDTNTSKVLADSIRNPNGIGVSPNGVVLTSTQEGEWTPASMIVEASQGGSYGWDFEENKETPDTPLVYIPRGVDNSSGGQLFVGDDRWGPFEGSFLGFSYGSCSYYLILKSEDGHGAVVPMPEEFLSGAHRARFNPVDSQLYVVGTQGWGTYAQYEGSFERVSRDKDQPVHIPNKFRVFTNGILVSFPDDKFVETQDVASQFFQQWNYRYSAGYGSPEYSVRHPQTVGHDAVKIASVTTLGDRSTLFFEIPELQAAMQSHLYFALETQSGAVVSGELFATALEVEQRFEVSEESAYPDQSPKLLGLADMVSKPVPSASEDNNEAEGREIVLKAVAGLLYDKNSFSVNAGELITIRLENTDTMPHNWILGKSGSYNRLGNLADALAADPGFADQGYVPTSPDIIAAIPTIAPGSSEITTFTAPSSPGTYPFLCTFPGHWRIMKGTLIVY